jgi:hypothetical protein
VPPAALERAASVHVSPPPDTDEIFCTADLGPSAEMNARISSFAPLVVKAGEVILEAAVFWSAETFTSSAGCCDADVIVNDVVAVGAGAQSEVPASLRVNVQVPGARMFTVAVVVLVPLVEAIEQMPGVAELKVTGSPDPPPCATTVVVGVP